MIDNYKGILQSQGGYCYCCQGEEKHKYSGRLYPYYSPLTKTLVGLFCPMCIILIRYETTYDVYRSRLIELKGKLERVKSEERFIDIKQMIARYTRVANVVNKVERRFENNA